jgi:hypothetical protein
VAVTKEFSGGCALAEQGTIVTYLGGSRETNHQHQVGSFEARLERLELGDRIVIKVGGVL